MKVGNDFLCSNALFVLYLSAYSGLSNYDTLIRFLGMTLGMAGGLYFSVYFFCWPIGFMKGPYLMVADVCTDFMSTMSFAVCLL